MRKVDNGGEKGGATLTVVPRIERVIPLECVMSWVPVLYHL